MGWGSVRFVFMRPKFVDCCFFPPFFWIYKISESPQNRWKYFTGGVADELEPDPQVEAHGMASLGIQGSGGSPCGRAGPDGRVSFRHLSRYPDGTDGLYRRTRDRCFLVLGKLDVCYAGDHPLLLCVADGLSFDVPAHSANGPLDLDHRGGDGNPARPDSDDHHPRPFRVVYADALSRAGGPF